MPTFKPPIRHHSSPWDFFGRQHALPALLTGFLLVYLVAPSPALPQQSAASAPAQLTYTKVLKGSDPEYEQITVRADGSGTYDGRKLAESPNPRAFQLSSSITQKLFDLAAELHDFQGIQLESRKRVADLGLKTFEYQRGAEVFHCQFNYSSVRAAQELTNLFENVGAVERHIEALDYAMRYDHLGLPRELTLIQIDLNNKALADPQLMMGTLEEIIHNPRFLHLAQVRAQNILDEITRNN
ncbi:MAG: hypothetical protein ACRD2B_11710 [Terriglobia bacterium]